MTETRYAKSGDVNIAYQIVGEGPRDLLYVPGWVSNVEAMWDEPTMAGLLGRLASFSRLILFDKRGTGLSDRVPTDKLPTLEQRMDDVRAVLDAAQSERTALFGHSEGGNMCMLFAATYPERTTVLITLGVYAKRIRSEDYPWAPTAEERDDAIRDVEARWGRFSREDAEYYIPSRVDDEQYLRRLESYFRRSASPGAAAALLRMNSGIDVRHVLPAIRVPTLCLHRSGDRDVNVEEGRYVASRIPGASFIELPGDDHWLAAGDVDRLADEIEEFLTGVRPIPQSDRVLATVLFTDIVGSTQQAVELGDRRWREVLESHHVAVRRELERFRGQEVDTAGDGFLATFDGPARAIRCAVAVRNSVQPLGLEVRAGLHTGECELLGGKVAGVAVHTGARIAALAEANEVLVSATVHDLVAGSGIKFEDRGERLLKGVGHRRIFAVTDA